MNTSLMVEGMEEEVLDLYSSTLRHLNIFLMLSLSFIIYHIVFIL